MKAPDKIYLQVCGDCPQTDCVTCKFEDLEGVTWNTDRIFPKDVEYTRTDAFIEKALAYLNSKFYFHNAFYGVVSTDFNAMEELFEDFRKYMEGEKV